RADLLDGRRRDAEPLRDVADGVVALQVLDPLDDARSVGRRVEVADETLLGDALHGAGLDVVGHRPAVALVGVRGGPDAVLAGEFRGELPDGDADVRGDPR